MAKISLTGIKPTGTPHLGNYLGSIAPALDLTKDYLSIYFIADWHALTTIKDGKELRPLIHKLAATWLACGLDPEKTVFFQQSHIPELAELNWYLACFTQKGQLNRAHAYKDVTSRTRKAIEKKFESAPLIDLAKHLGFESVKASIDFYIQKYGSEYQGPTLTDEQWATLEGHSGNVHLAINSIHRKILQDILNDMREEVQDREEDSEVNVGLYTYPVLMSADILLFGSDVVPVGQDQKQHVEIARDIAETVNRQMGSIFNIPEPLIREDVKTIPGLDGRKMSKSYDNVIPFLAPPSEMKKAVMKIVTDSKRPEEPKDPDADNVFNIFKHFAEPARVEERRKHYQAGGVGYGEMKEELLATLETRFGAARAKYDELLKDPAGLDKILAQGAERARQLAGSRMEKLRKKLGLR